MLRASCRGHEQEVTDLALSCDGKLLASGSIDATVRVWSMRVGRLPGGGLFLVGAAADRRAGCTCTLAACAAANPKQKLRAGERTP
jgi:WD40 repeat protein